MLLQALQRHQVLRLCLLMCLRPLVAAQKQVRVEEGGEEQYRLVLTPLSLQWATHLR